MRFLTMIRQHKRIVTIVALLALAAGLGAVFYPKRTAPLRQAFVPVAPADVKQSAEALSYVCSGRGTALLCQNQDGKPVKYALPDTLAKAERIIPSRDERRFLVVTPGNPVHQPAAKRVYVTDDRFKVVRELPASEAGRSTGFTWAANSNYLLYARSMPENKQELAMFDIETGNLHLVAGSLQASGQPAVTADGKHVLLPKSTSGERFDLVTVETETGTPRQANTEDLYKHITAFANVSYHAGEDRLYITGSDAQKRPVLVVARLQGDVVHVVRAIQDGFAYTPLTLSKSGMLAKRADADGKTSHVVISKTGDISKSVLKPFDRSVFGLSQAPGTAASSSATFSAADYRYSYVGSTPAAVQDLMAGLNPTQCQDGSFASVDLLAKTDDNTQLSILTVPCDSGGIAWSFYRRDAANGYEKLLTSSGPPECSGLDRVRLARSLAPSCVEGPRADESGSGDMNRIKLEEQSGKPSFTNKDVRPGTEHTVNENPDLPQRVVLPEGETLRSIPVTD